MSLLRQTQAMLSTLSLALFIFFISFNTKYNSPTPTMFLQHSSPPHPHFNFSLLIGILTRPDRYDHRHFLRLVYGAQSSPIARIHIKFVLCHLTKQEQRVLIALEIMRFDDIIILNCSENMSSRKKKTYFSSLPRILPTRYDYVMKANDDVFLRLEPFAMSLNLLPRFDLYYGFACPCMNPFVHYMSGMGFVLSWDLVEWISSSLIPVNHTFGPEDKLVREWLNRGNRGKNNRFSDKPVMYDYPGTNTRCSHDLTPNTVAVHRVKKWDQWIHVLSFFNVTKEIKPSKFYNL